MHCRRSIPDPGVEENEKPPGRMTLTPRPKTVDAQTQDQNLARLPAEELHLRPRLLSGLVQYLRELGTQGAQRLQPQVNAPAHTKSSVSADSPRFSLAVYVKYKAQFAKSLLCRPWRVRQPRISVNSASPSRA